MLVALRGNWGASAAQRLDFSLTQMFIQTYSDEVIDFAEVEGILILKLLQENSSEKQRGLG